MKILPYGLIVLGVSLGLLAGCTQEQKDEMTAKAEAVVSIVKHTCDFAPTIPTVLKIMNADPTVVQVADYGAMICAAVIASKTMVTAVGSSCHGTVAGVCVEGDFVK